MTKDFILAIELMGVDFSLLKGLVDSKKTYDFAIEHQGQNFNDLYERMDDHSFINNTTINDMNSLSKYFVGIHDKLMNHRGF